MTRRDLVAAFAAALIPPQADHGIIHAALFDFIDEQDNRFLGNF